MYDHYYKMLSLLRYVLHACFMLPGMVCSQTNFDAKKLTQLPLKLTQVAEVG